VKRELEEVEEVITANPKKSLERVQIIRDKFNIDSLKKLSPLALFIEGKCYFEQRSINREKMLNKAKKKLTLAVELIDKREDLHYTNIRSACLNELSRTTYFQNNLKQALAYVEEGLECFYKGGEREIYFYHLLLNKVIYLDKLDEKEKAYQAVKTLWDKINSFSQGNLVLNITLDIIIQAHMMYSSLLNDLNMPQQALDFAYKGIDIAQKNKYFDRVLTLKTQLGSIYHKLGHYENAEKCYLSALDFEEKIGKWQKHLLIQSYWELGVLYTRQKNWTKAQKMLKKAVNISLEVEDIIASIDSLWSLGNCFAKQKHFDKAIQTYLKAEELLIKHNYPSRLRKIIISLGYCYKQVDNNEKYEYYKEKLFNEQELDWRDDM
jgi:tetratricopeptide (TPR) repeat protein